MAKQFTDTDRRRYGAEARRYGRGGPRRVADRIGVAPGTVRRWQRLPPAARPAASGCSLKAGRPDSATGTEARPGNGAAVEPQPPPRLSPTGASTFEQCPRRWRFRYVDRIEDPPGKEAQIGTFAHRALQRLLELPRAERTLDSARRIAAEEWPPTETSADFTRLGLDSNHARGFRWQAWHAIEGLWAVERPENVEVVGTEQTVDVDLDGVPFTGVIDRLERRDGQLVITDYKTGRAPPVGYSGRHVHQLMLYAAAVAEQTGEMPASVRAVYLGQRPVKVPVTDKSLASAVDRLASTWSDINNACTKDQFEPSPGPLCGWCSYTSRCPDGAAENERRSQQTASTAA